MSNEHLNEIIIISGEQAGARAQLKMDEILTLSGDIDTDIVIRDQLIKDEKINISYKNDNIYVQVVNGRIEIDGKEISHSKKVRLQQDAKVKIGETIFVCRPLSKPADEYFSTDLSKEENRNRSSSSYTVLNYRHSNLIIMILALTIIGAVTIIANNEDVNDNKVSMSVASNVQKVFIDNGYHSLRVEEKGFDQLSITGFIQTYKERADVEVLIEEYGIPALLELEVGEQLANEVRELYRVNGVEVETNVTNGGNVHILSDSAQAERVEEIKSIALTEIRKLKNLTIEYNNEEEKEQTISNEITYKESDKRITMVVDGDPAFIMTSDQAKYYIGALLPTGYKIVDILDQQVVLEKKGKTTTLSF